jgi:uncharacterized protein YndB with AHSA1/START domain
VRAPLPRVFEALVNADQVARWWASDVRIEAEVGGRYEGTTAEGRIEGTITAIDGPGELSYMWPMAADGGPVDTTVAFHLSPKGSETFVRLLHRAPKPVPGDWAGAWDRALDALKALLEGAGPPSG